MGYYIIESVINECEIIITRCVISCCNESQAYCASPDVLFLLPSWVSLCTLNAHGSFVVNKRINVPHRDNQSSGFFFLLLWPLMISLIPLLFEVHLRSFNFFASSMWSLAKKTQKNSKYAMQVQTSSILGLCKHCKQGSFYCSSNMLRFIIHAVSPMYNVKQSGKSCSETIR